MNRWLAAWGPAAAWAAFLFFMSSRSTLPVGLGSGLDKVAHFGAYFVLGFLLAHATTRLQRAPQVAIMLGLVYGFLDEFHQSFVPGRDASVGDWVADALGTVLGVLLFLFVRRTRGPTREQVTGTSAKRASS